MTLNLQLPPDIESAARMIPDLQDRVISFVRHQVDIEKWREGRYSEEAQKLVNDGFAEADRWNEQGLSREEVARRFKEVQERISGRIS